jgi:tRNA G18 (ribose-2'-O)-methylase SpoU
MMRNKGYFGIGCYAMKNVINYGTLFRTAQIFGADFIFVIGCRFKRQPSDTMKSWKHLPSYDYTDFDDFNSHRPIDCPLICIELDSQAVDLNTFVHPKSACYLLGAEDHGLPATILKKAQSIVKLPGERSLNVSVAGSIVLYDRITKCNK